MVCNKRVLLASVLAWLQLVHAHDNSAEAVRGTPRLVVEEAVRRTAYVTEKLHAESLPGHEHRRAAVNTVTAPDADAMLQDWKLPNNLPAPSTTDYADASRSIVTLSLTTDHPARRDNLGVLIDGEAQRTGNDNPRSVHFDNMVRGITSTPENRLLFDMATPVLISMINTYSWHKNTRANQYYDLYCLEEDLDTPPPCNGLVKSPELPSHGWHKFAAVKTNYDRWVEHQVGVSVHGNPGSDGKPLPMVRCRYVLMDLLSPSTLYGEVDIFKAQNWMADEMSPTVRVHMGANKVVRLQEENGSVKPVIPFVEVPEQELPPPPVPSNQITKEPALQIIPQRLGSYPVPSFLSSATTPKTVSKWYTQSHYDGCLPLHDIKFRSLSNEDRGVFEMFYTEPTIQCNGVVVEVGALDGISVSPSYFFELGLTWQAILIEANPAFHSALKNNRPDAYVEHGAFCPSSTSKNLYYKEGPHNAYQGDFYYNLADELGSDGGFLSSEVAQPLLPDVFDVNAAEEVPCVTMPQVIQSASAAAGGAPLERIDVMFLHVDGNPLAVLQDLQSWNVRVSVLVIELDGSSEERDDVVRQTLGDNGYHKAEVDIRRWCASAPSLPESHCSWNEVWVDGVFRDEKEEKRRERRNLRQLRT